MGATHARRTPPPAAGSRFPARAPGSVSSRHVTRRLNRPVFCIRSGWWLGPDRRWMLTVVRVFGSVAPLRYVGQRGEPAARTHQGEHHDRYRSWELVRCTCRKSPSISQACGGMFTAMTTSSKTRGTTARKKEIGRGSIHFSTSPTSGTIKMQPIVFEVASC